MKSIFTKLLLILCILSIPACVSTNAKYQQVLNSWMNYPLRDILVVWGAPYDTYQISPAEELIVYVHMDDISLPRGTFIPTLANNYCKTTFHIQNGLVNKWTAEGTCKTQ